MLISLGRWQLRRADEKRVLFDSFAAGTDATRLIDLGTPRLPRYQHIEAGGHYDQARQILIDNMVNAERAGYFVITPFALTGGGWVLVNRGWVPLGASRAVLPTIPVTGDTRRLRGGAIICRVPAFSWAPGRCLRHRIRWSRPFRIMPSWRSSCGNPPGQRPRIWCCSTLPSPTATCAIGRRPDFRRCATFGYAVQWFALALTLFVIYVVTNLRRDARRDPRDRAQRPGSPSGAAAGRFGADVFCAPWA